ncbi:MAG: RNA polymerase sigma-70 factor [Mangrovibacterium sp.]
MIIQDIESFNMLFESHYEWACAVALAFVHDPYIAEDIVIETFVAIWEKRNTIHTSLRPYLLKSIRNRSLNHIRHKKAQAKLKGKVQEDMLTYQENFILQTEHPFNYVDKKETDQLLWEAIEQLPLQCRRIFIMNHFEEKSYQEIADELHISKNTIKSQLRIAFSKLQFLLKDKFIFLFL